jgi:hypothetical protein
MVETAFFRATNALILADEGSGFEPTTVLRAPDQSTGLGAALPEINWPTPPSSAVGDFTGGGETRLLLPQPTSLNFQGSPSYTFRLGTGGGTDEEPTASASESVDASTDAGSTVEFGDTGTSVTFSDETSGSGDVTVDRFESPPEGTAGIEGNASEYRVEISLSGDLSVGDSTEVRFDVAKLAGVSDPTGVTIYTREIGGLGRFAALETTYDEEANELVAFVSGFSEFAFGSETEPLPVELASLDARVDDEQVRLTWQTASETNNAGFRIQRRKGEGAKGRVGEWTTVGSIEGNGTTSQAQSYQFTDANLPYEADALTYRLKQVDTDGSGHFSKTITVERSATKVRLLGTFPNPAGQQATLRYALPEKQETTIRLYDVLGRQVRTVVSGTQEGRQERTLDVSGLSSGVYVLRLRSDEQVRTQKLTVVR